MTIQDFAAEAKDHARAYLDSLGETHVSIMDADIVKANDTTLHGFVLIRDGFPGGPNVYLDDLFERHTEGEDIEDLMRLLDERCRICLMCPMPPTALISDLSLDSIRPRLDLRLLDVRRNQSYLAGRPYIDTGYGLVMIADINIDEEIYGEWRVAVNNSIMKDTGCSCEELLTAAMANTMRLAPPLMLDLSDHLISGNKANLLDLPAGSLLPGRGPFVLTNEQQINGAVVLFYPGVMEKLKEFMTGGFYALPISIHEFLIVPNDPELDPGRLKEVLLSGNSEIVDEEDVLSDRILFWDPDSPDRLRLCS